MSEAKHTPGPWILTESPVHYIGDGLETYEISSETKRQWIAHTLELADARLIAAAPELLSMLKKLSSESIVRQEVRDLIAKAEGRE